MLKFLFFFIHPSKLCNVNITLLLLRILCPCRQWIIRPTRALVTFASSERVSCTYWEQSEQIVLVLICLYFGRAITVAAAADPQGAMGDSPAVIKFSLYASKLCKIVTKMFTKPPFLNVICIFSGEQHLPTPHPTPCGEGYPSPTLLPFRRLSSTYSPPI